MCSMTMLLKSEAKQGCCTACEAHRKGFLKSFESVSRAVVKTLGFASPRKPYAIRVSQESRVEGGH